MFKKIVDFIVNTGHPVLVIIMFCLIVLIILLLIISGVILFLKNHKKISKLSIIRQGDDHYLVWFNNYHTDLNTKKRLIDSDLIITANNQEILRINNPTNVGKYKLSNEFVYQNLKSDENLKGTFNVNYFTRNHNIKIKNVFTKNINKNNIVLIKNFSYMPLVKFKQNGYELNIEIDFIDSKNITKMELLLYETLDFDEEPIKRIEIKKIKNNYKIILKEKEEGEYACAILRITVKDKNDKYAAPQLVEEILYLE